LALPFAFNGNFRNVLWEALPPVDLRGV